MYTGGRQGFGRMAPRLYRYGVTIAIAWLAANYTAWALDVIDWRCIAVALFAGLIVLVLTDGRWWRDPR